MEDSDDPTPEELYEMMLELEKRDPNAPTGKTWAQVLEENPHHAGGLAQLAEAERDALARMAVKQEQLRATLAMLAQSDATLARMLKTDRPLTRETWLAMNFPDGVPDPLPAEIEAEIPEPLRDA